MKIYHQIESNHYDRSASNLKDMKKYYESYIHSLHQSFTRQAHKDWTIAVHRQMKQLKRGRILDFGCGTGIRTTEFAIHPWRLIGIDLSSESITKALDLKEYLNLKDAEYIIMNGEDLRFDDNYFDIVLDYGTFSSIDVSIAMKEIVRVLKPGGSLIAIETLGHNWFFNLKRHINVLRGKRTVWAAGHIMKLQDWRKIENLFKKTDLFFYSLLTPFFSPLYRLLPSRVCAIVLKGIEKIEEKILKIKFLQRFAFKTVVVLSNPIK